MLLPGHWPTAPTSMSRQSTDRAFLTAIWGLNTLPGALDDEFRRSDCTDRIECAQNAVATGSVALSRGGATGTMGVGVQDSTGNPRTSKRPRLTGPHKPRTRRVRTPRVPDPTRPGPHASRTLGVRTSRRPQPPRHARTLRLSAVITPLKRKLLECRRKQRGRAGAEVKPRDQLPESNRGYGGSDPCHEAILVMKRSWL